MDETTAKAIIFALLFSFVLYGVQGFTLTLLHTNDNHGRFEETDSYGFLCYPRDAQAGKCFGGVARRATMLKQIRSEEKSTLLVSGGDVFTGTLWYRVYRGNATSKFMNELRYDALVSAFLIRVKQVIHICSSRRAVVYSFPNTTKRCIKRDELWAIRLPLLTKLIYCITNTRMFEYINAAKCETIRKKRTNLLTS